MEQVNFSLLEALVLYGRVGNSRWVLTRECQALFPKAVPLLWVQPAHRWVSKAGRCSSEVRDSEQPLCNVILDVILVNVLADQPSSMKGFY